MARAALIFFLLAAALAAQTPPITFNDDGAWSWFQDPRAIITKGKLIIGSVAAKSGDVEATIYDLATGSRTKSTLHVANPGSGPRRYDDHNAPAFLVRPDGQILAVYAKHGTENRFYYRISSGEERSFVPSEKSRITYSNLFRLSSEHGRIYNFFRGLDDSFKPSYAWSDDGGESWAAGNVFIDVPAAFRHRPYVKYASDGLATIHFLYTDGHPRDFNNSVYHVYYRGGRLYRSDGKPIRSLREGLREPGEGTTVFQGDPNNVAWVHDLHLDRAGRPFAAYSVQKNSAGMPPRHGGEDLRYRYARWTGTRWEDREIACAGSRLYAGEDDYAGGIALDPGDPGVVFISTNADPATGKALRHYEIFRGISRDGTHWKWTPLTVDSTADNIRPVVPQGDGRQKVVLWLRGRYSSYTNYDLAVVGVILKK